MQVVDPAIQHLLQEIMQSCGTCLLYKLQKIHIHQLITSAQMTASALSAKKDDALLIQLLQERK